MGQPTIGRKFFNREPGEEILGVVSEDITDSTPQQASATWAGGDMSLTEPPPPWELEDGEFTQSDARRYVDVPENWVLRWANPKLIEATGWREWKTVKPSDGAHVKLKVDSMLCPDGTIRRGGATGDVLVWMYRSWVESRRQQLLRATQRQSDSAVRQQEQLYDEFARRGLRVDHAKHPTHTMAEGRSMTD